MESSINRLKIWLKDGAPIIYNRDGGQRASTERRFSMPNKIRWIVVIGVTIIPSILFSNEMKRPCTHKFSGYMFGDYYYVAANHDSTYQGQRGFWMRRIYFTYDHMISKRFSVRLRMEMNSPDFTKDPAKLTPFVKDAYLKLKLRRLDFIFGISPTPTWDLIEHFWGYRSVEKTPLDLQKFGHSRDFGIALKGKIDPEKRLGYHLMYANGEGNKSENNKFKKLMGAVDLKLAHLIVQIYGDWEQGAENKDVYTYQGFLGLKFKRLKVGTHYARQIRKTSANKHDTYDIASGFLTFYLRKRIRFLLRYDKMYNRSPQGISYIPFAQAKSNLLIAGIDFSPNKLVHLIPNIEYVFYEETKGYKPDPDLYLRLTFYYKFK